MKPVNRGLANEFHVWQRAGGPSGSRALKGCTILDIDAWAVVSSDPKTCAPVALYELKRSYLEPEAWRPFDADRPNYAALQALARLAGIPFYTVYWKKGVPIEDSTPLGVWTFSEIAPEYHGFRQVIPAADFARLWPFPLDRSLAL